MLNFDLQSFFGVYGLLILLLMNCNYIDIGLTDTTSSLYDIIYSRYNRMEQFHPHNNQMTSNVHNGYAG